MNESEAKKLDEITNAELRKACSKANLNAKGGKLDLYLRLKKAGKDPFKKSA